MMPIRIVAVVAFAVASLLQTGCAMFEPMRDMSRRSWKGFTAGGRDHQYLEEDEVDEHAYVGDIARGHLPREQDPDAWYKRWLMSSKARDIERNLGID